MAKGTFPSLPKTLEESDPLPSRVVEKLAKASHDQHQLTIDVYGSNLKSQLIRPVCD